MCFVSFLVCFCFNLCVCWNGLSVVLVLFFFGLFCLCLFCVVCACFFLLL